MSMALVCALEVLLNVLLFSTLYTNQHSNIRNLIRKLDFLPPSFQPIFSKDLEYSYNDDQMANQATSLKAAETGGEDIKNCLNKRESHMDANCLSAILSKIKTEPLISWSLSPHFSLSQKMTEEEVEEEVVSMVI